MNDTEIDVSPLLASPGFDPWNCCNSVANPGQDAGKLTWRASQRFAPALVLSEGQKEAFRDFVRDSGGWDDEEIAAFSDTDLAALCVQWIAGDIREGFGDGVSNDPAKWDWEDYNERAERGSVSSTFYLHDGKLFWSCAN
ncbi:MAG: hypothetical protein BWY17_05381 [Deltaproteobacteria bacterium ADurb.Bin207]|nr:MAG: hypothetical protein BWY17_05381 [Deltaproteobacteria bacterium ADurb.Bin207]